MRNHLLSKCRLASIVTGILAVTLSSQSSAITPAGGWTLSKPSPSVKDYFLRVDVDPGQTYGNAASPSSVYWAQYIAFENANGGYWGLQRAGGTKLALASIWDGTDAIGGALPAVVCYEFGQCSSIKGQYEWKVGHQYKMRIEASPRYGGNWWQLTLYDLTLGTADVLGRISTPANWGGLSSSSGLFLEYFWGPYQCDTLRHSKTTYAPVRGNWGRDTSLSRMNGDAYGSADVCDASFMLPGMTSKDHGSTSWVAGDGTVTAVGNNYRGLFRWGQFDRTAKAGMFFAADPSSDYPYMYRAKHDGEYWYFPAEGQSNADWESVGRGYPVINDLYYRNQPLRDWSERNAAHVAVGDYFAYDNPYTGDLEYFTLLKEGAEYFPIDKTSNEFWAYKGRHFRKNETIPALKVHQWGENNRYGRAGQVFQYGNAYFRLKTNDQYWYFPVAGSDNDWWEFLGYHL